MTGVIGLVLILVIASLGARRAAGRGRRRPGRRLELPPSGGRGSADDGGRMDMAGGTSDPRTTDGEPRDGEAPPAESGEAPPAGLAGIHFGPGWDEDPAGGVQDGAEEAGPVEPEEPPR